METILAVDDNRINDALYQQVIAGLPEVETVCFEDPQAALTWCESALPAVAIVDYRMPDIDGVQFIRRFRKIRGAESIPVVMLTSISSPVLWQMALDAGANAFLLKLIDKGRFLACMAQFINQRPLAAAVHET